MKLRARAKINLSLKVLGKRPDSFHEIESVMQSVSLHDVITLTPGKSGLEVTCDNPRVPLGKNNLVYKAAEVFLGKENREKRTGIKIHIEKHIPMAAGLAGGSADAAAVLFGLEVDPALAEQIGSDVPFCLVGGRCLVKGRGEIVVPETAELIPQFPPRFYIIVCPEFEISAKWAYGEWDRREGNREQGTGKNVNNDLEPVVMAKYPVIQEIKTLLLNLGCSLAQMSGSGPSVFGVIASREKGKKILAKIKHDYAQAFLVESVDQGIEII